MEGAYDACSDFGLTLNLDGHMTIAAKTFIRLPVSKAQVQLGVELSTPTSTHTARSEPDILKTLP
jgi:hypothetical protein